MGKGEKKAAKGGKKFRQNLTHWQQIDEAEYEISSDEEKTKKNEESKSKQSKAKENKEAAAKNSDIRIRTK